MAAAVSGVRVWSEVWEPRGQRKPGGGCGFVAVIGELVVSLLPRGRQCSVAAVVVGQRCDWAWSGHCDASQIAKTKWRAQRGKGSAPNAQQIAMIRIR